MKERTIRRLITACLFGSLGLSGCQLFAPKPPQPILARGPVGSRFGTPLPEKTLHTGTTVNIVEPKEDAKPEEPMLPLPRPESPPDPPSPPSEPTLEEPKKVTELAEPVEEAPKVTPDQPVAEPEPVPPEPVLPEPALPEPGPLQPVSAELASKVTTHADDYSWLCGEVLKVTTARGEGWRLRYVGMDEVDTYGGSVLLVAETHRLQGLKDGQRVRVTGRLLNPELRSAGTPYHVESFTVVGE